MGDRGNIIFQVEGLPDLYMYTHWRGSQLDELVADSLRRGQSRWDDDSYLARILFCGMLMPEDLMGTTGYGIGTVYGDGGSDVYVNVSEQEVTAINGDVYTFDKFVAKFASA